MNLSLRKFVIASGAVVLLVLMVAAALALFVALRFRVAASSNDQLKARTAATYVAQTIAIKGKQGAFIQWLTTNHMPVARQLRQDGLLAGQRVYALVWATESKSETVEWDYLILYELPEGVAPANFLSSAAALLNTDAAAADGPFETYRVEVLDSTPDAYFPLPSTAAQGDRTLAYTVEYINVHEDALADYQKSMILNSGPAMKKLVAQGFVHSFNALETTQLVYAKPGAQTWNQIHIIGFKPLNLLRFIPTYDQALQQVTPDGQGFDAVVAHLNEICENTRVDLARELSQFRL